MSLTDSIIEMATYNSAMGLSIQLLTPSTKSLSEKLYESLRYFNPNHDLHNEHAKCLQYYLRRWPRY
jgi:hypothetical protein